MYNQWQQWTPGVAVNPVNPQQIQMMQQQQQVYWQQYYPQQGVVAAGQPTSAAAPLPPGQPPLPSEPNPPLPPESPSGKPTPPAGSPPGAINPAPPIEPPTEDKPPLPSEPPPPLPTSSSEAPVLAATNEHEQLKMNSLQAQAAQWQQQQKQWAEYQQSAMHQQPAHGMAQPPPPQGGGGFDALAREEAEFEKQYSDWMKQYTDWKEQNKNHPNQEQYLQYEQQWKTYEQQMENKRRSLQQRRDQLTASSSSSSQAPPHNPPPLMGQRGPAPQRMRGPRPGMDQQPRGLAPMRGRGGPRGPDFRPQGNFTRGPRPQHPGQFHEDPVESYETAEYQDEMGEGQREGMHPGQRGRGRGGPPPRGRGAPQGGAGPPQRGRGGWGNMRGGTQRGQGPRFQGPTHHEEYYEEEYPEEGFGYGSQGEMRGRGMMGMRPRGHFGPPGRGAPRFDGPRGRGHPARGMRGGVRGGGMMAGYEGGWGEEEYAPRGRGMPPRGRGRGRGHVMHPLDEFMDYGEEGMARGRSMLKAGENYEEFPEESQPEAETEEEKEQPSGPQAPQLQPPHLKEKSQEKDSEDDGNAMKLFSAREHELIIKAAEELKALREMEDHEEGEKPAAPTAPAPAAPAPTPSRPPQGPPPVAKPTGPLVPYGDEESEVDGRMDEGFGDYGRVDSFRGGFRGMPRGHPRGRPPMMSRGRGGRGFGPPMGPMGRGPDPLRDLINNPMLIRDPLRDLLVHDPLMDPIRDALRGPPRDPLRGPPMRGMRDPLEDMRREEMRRDEMRREEMRRDEMRRDEIRREEVRREEVLRLERIQMQEEAERLELERTNGQPAGGPAKVIDYGHGQDTAEARRKEELPAAYRDLDNRVMDDPKDRDNYRERSFERRDFEQDYRPPRDFRDSHDRDIRDREFHDREGFDRDMRERDFRDRDSRDFRDSRGERGDRLHDRGHSRDRERGFDRHRERDRRPPFDRSRDTRRDSKDPDFDFRSVYAEYRAPAAPRAGESSRPQPKAESLTVEDLLCNPGRKARPEHVVVLMRGLPGSGKTYASKLLKNKEVKNGGAVPRMLSIDDYFMVEVEKSDKDPETGKRLKRTVMEYEFDPAMEESYLRSLFKSYKRQVDERYFSFIIVDAIFDRRRALEEFWSYGKSKGFQVYVAEVSAEPKVCAKRNVHGRSLREIEKIANSWDVTPANYISLDIRSLLQDAAIEDVEMEDGSEEKGGERKEDEEEEEEEAVEGHVKSKWELDTHSQDSLAKLDGVRKRNRKDSGPQAMEDYLQLPDDYNDREDDPGKKRVRWADLEERKSQVKMREMGFVIGHTNWDKMVDDDYADKALNRTKFI